MRKSVFIVVTLITVIAVFKFAFGNTEKKYTEYYEVHKIVNGDTLWSIARTYSDDNIKTYEYVEKIKNFNGMKNDNIKSGQQIIIPVYLEK
ncbi:MAG: LysM peptidoglycan-binding domain-containing protein [Clostridia bacterium]|jgi:LysM repeat protein|nr:LysM peptidoglycan-binding domain-containing protein [Clostridia bacterium]MCI1999147.1 LysM peptidoglycan-binding domain-containing protein [Clostridia bacterium]MCI2013897.1 LysM peptidoglycan-binding domain-containing protein [Clostridia bacterium]